MFFSVQGAGQEIVHDVIIMNSMSLHRVCKLQTYLNIEGF